MTISISTLISDPAATLTRAGYFLKEKSAMFTVAALCFSGAIAGAANVYQTGFEPPTYSLGTLNNQDSWFAYPQTSSAVVENTVVHSGSQAIKITPGNNTTTTYGAGHSDSALFTNSSILTISDYANFSSSGTANFWTPVGAFYNGGGNTLLNVDASGHISYSINGTNTATGVTATDGVWNQFQLVVNYSSQTVTGYYNGAAISAPQSFNLSTDLSLNNVQIYSQPNTAATPQVGYFDDLQITTAQAPEPAAILFVSVGLCFIGGLRTQRKRAARLINARCGV